MRLIKDYMRNAKLRGGLNKLAEETFGISFENWVTDGYFDGEYIPYSYEENGRILANVSANRMRFVQNGKERFFIQIGTVMTAPDQRKKGYAAELMRQVIEDYQGTCDGIYLFANLSALGFYEKLGFQNGLEYRYLLKKEKMKKIREEAAKRERKEGFLPVSAEDQTVKQQYEKALRDSKFFAALEQTNKYALQMFYTSGLEDVWYCKDLDCYVVIEQDGTTLCLQSVLCQNEIRLEQVLTRIREDYDRLMLGFAPKEADAGLFDAELYDGADDYRLFYLGEKLAEIETEKLFFPVFSHA